MYTGLMDDGTMSTKQYRYVMRSESEVSKDGKLFKIYPEGLDHIKAYFPPNSGDPKLVFTIAKLKTDPSEVLHGKIHLLFKGNHSNTLNHIEPTQLIVSEEREALTGELTGTGYSSGFPDGSQRTFEIKFDNRTNVYRYVLRLNQSKINSEGGGWAYMSYVKDSDSPENPLQIEQKFNMNNLLLFNQWIKNTDFIPCLGMPEDDISRIREIFYKSEEDALSGTPYEEGYRLFRGIKHYENIEAYFSENGINANNDIDTPLYFNQKPEDIIDKILDTKTACKTQEYLEWRYTHEPSSTLEDIPENDAIEIDLVNDYQDNYFEQSVLNQYTIGPLGAGIHFNIDSVVQGGIGKDDQGLYCNTGADWSFFSLYLLRGTENLQLKFNGRADNPYIVAYKYDTMDGIINVSPREDDLLVKSDGDGNAAIDLSDITFANDGWLYFAALAEEDTELSIDISFYNNIQQESHAEWLTSTVFDLYGNPYERSRHLHVSDYYCGDGVNDYLIPLNSLPTSSSTRPGDSDSGGFDPGGSPDDDYAGFGIGIECAANGDSNGLCDIAPFDYAAFFEMGSCDLSVDLSSECLTDYANDICNSYTTMANEAKKTKIYAHQIASDNCGVVKPKVGYSTVSGRYSPFERSGNLEMECLDAEGKSCEKNTLPTDMLEKGKTKAKMVKNLVEGKLPLSGNSLKNELTMQTDILKKCKGPNILGCFRDEASKKVESLKKEQESLIGDTTASKHSLSESATKQKRDNYNPTQDVLQLLPPLDKSAHILSSNKKYASKTIIRSRSSRVLAYQKEAAALDAQKITSNAIPFSTDASKINIDEILNAVAFD
jgi:hypothetical protein